jgi:P-type E1-E2 ATPase
VPPECIVIRDGCPISVLSKDIVVGDLVVLQTGAKVPADIRAVTSHNLRIDKSLLTGEAEPCKV